MFRSLIKDALTSFLKENGTSKAFFRWLGERAVNVYKNTLAAAQEVDADVHADLWVEGIVGEIVEEI